MQLPLISASPPSIFSLLEVFLPVAERPKYGNGAGTPSGLGGVMGGMLLIAGAVKQLCSVLVVAICRPPIVVGMQWTSNRTWGWSQGNSTSPDRNRTDVLTSRTMRCPLMRTRPSSRSLSVLAPLRSCTSTSARSSTRRLSSRSVPSLSR